MLGTFFVTSATGTVLLFSIVGISWAVTSRMPFSLIGDELSQAPTYWNEEDLSNCQGLIYGLHNLAICLPQMIIMSVMGTVWLLTETKDDYVQVVWFLRCGGIFALVATYFTTRLDERFQQEEDVQCAELPSEATSL